MKKIGFIDMDDVTADFKDWFHKRDLPIIPPVPEMYEKGFFRNLKPTKGATVAVNHIMNLCRHFDYELHILTQPVKDSPHSYSEKVEWVREHLPELVHNIHMTQDKSIYAKEGRFLIDDNLKKWGPSFEEHGGSFIHFDYEFYKSNPALVWEGVFKQVYEHCRRFS